MYETEGVSRSVRRGRGVNDPLAVSARANWDPTKGDFKIGSHDPVAGAKTAWKDTVESDWGWAVPFAWPEKLGAMAGYWGPGGILDQPQMAPMMGGAAGGLGALNLFQGGTGSQITQEALQGFHGQGTRGQGNLAQSFGGQQTRPQQPPAPYFLGSAGLGRL